MKKAFSLVELMIVVAVIGILAALVVPKISNYAQQAKEAAAKENLQILRDAIELYASQHGGIPPGYPNNNPAEPPSLLSFALQLVKTTDSSGVVGTKGTPGFIYGPYLPKIPLNPLNGNSSVRMVTNTGSFPEPTEKFGYIYKPATKTIKLDMKNSDLNGVPYLDY